MLKENLGRPGLVRLIDDDMCMSFEKGPRLRKDAVGDDDLLLFHSFLLSLLQRLAQTRAKRIDNDDTGKDRQQDRGDLVISDEPQGGHELETDAARADDAEHGGGAEVVFPTIERDVGELRKDLRDYRMRDDLQGVAPAARAASSGFGSTCSIASA